MTQQRIGIVLPELCAGGGVALYMGLAKRLLERGHKVDLVLLSIRGDYRESIPKECSIFGAGGKRTDDEFMNYLHRQHKFNCLNLEGLSAITGQIGLRWWWRHAGPTPSKSKIARNGELVRRYLNEYRPNAIFGGSTEANWAAIIGSMRADINLCTVVTVHNNYELGRDCKMKECSRLLYPKADWVVGVSQGVAECVSSTLRLNPIRTRHIYNGFSIHEIRRKANDSRGPGVALQRFEVPTVLSIARQSSGGAKDVDTLIRAFATVRKQRASKLILLRPGENDEETDRLESLAVQCQVVDDVVFLGFTENPYSFMKHASVLVVSSRWEGLPSVLIEAMACGTPVVSTDTPFGPAEILDGGRYGPMVPVGDVEQMAEAIIDVLGGKHLSIELLQARAAEFGIERMADQYEELLLGR